MNSDQLGTVAASTVAILHALGSVIVQIIRAWKQPVTIAKPPVTPPATAPTLPSTKITP